MRDVDNKFSPEDIELLRQRLPDFVENFQFEEINRVLSLTNIDDILPGHEVPLLTYVCGRPPTDFMYCLPEYHQLLDLIFKHKPNVWVQDPLGWTCLHYAARVGNYHAVSAILGAFENMPYWLKERLNDFINLPANDGKSSFDATLEDVIASSNQCVKETKLRNSQQLSKSPMDKKTHNIKRPQYTKSKEERKEKRQLFV